GRMGGRSGGEATADPPVRPSASPSIRPSARARSGAERNLLGVLLAHADWTERARHDGIKAEWFERPEYREIFAQLLAGAPLPDALSDSAQLVWQELKGSVQGEAENIGDVYEATREALEARPFLRKFDTLQAQIDIAAPDEVEALLRHKEEMRLELQRRFPNEWQRRPLRRAGRKA
ncbi:MAG: hypothetical protein WBC97_01590, partial [Gemmatimonadales bacterium]